MTFSVGMLVYMIYHTITFNFGVYNAKELTEVQIYFVIEYLTIVFKIVISSYAIYAIKRLDDVVNPLFLFSILFAAFATIQTISFFSIGGFKNELIVIATMFIDLIVAIIFLATTFVLKLDDWKSTDFD